MLMMNNHDNMVAYFSMEIGIDPEIKTYGGGLGILAGDTLRSLADTGVPAAGITLLSEYGYFTQKIIEGRQEEDHNRWPVERYLDKLDESVVVPLNNGQIHLNIWRYSITGINKHKVPIYFLDANHPANISEHRKLTQKLYPANPTFRLLQEIILGIGGVKALDSLDLSPSVYHLNEGHSAFLTLELLKRAYEADIEFPREYVRDISVFTTHTPVPAGHDKFPDQLIKQYLPYYDLLHDIPNACEPNGDVNMTRLALAMSEKVNGVAKKHTEVSRKMFPNYSFSSITNGIHHTFWTSPSFQALFEDYLPGWFEDPFSLFSALNIPRERIEQAHSENKKHLMNHIKSNHGATLDPEIFTIGFARRMTKYKRADLLFYDLERLNAMAEKHPIQLVFAGKAHYSDKVGKSIIKEILSLKPKFHDNIKLVFLENYNVNLAKLIIPGVDVWLNTPMRPLEASGTSGMKASINGVPNLSILDGWWIEGAIEGVTGWSIGPQPAEFGGEKQIYCVDCDDSEDLYHKLENVVLPLFYEDRHEFTRIRRNCIALHGSYFNTHRMVQQYLIKSYLT